MQASISLTSGLRTELRGFKLLRESAKLAGRALLHRRQTTAWLELLNSHPLFSQMLPGCPRLVNKIYRNYLSSRLDCYQRLDALQTHYRTVIAEGLAPLVARAAGSAAQDSVREASRALHGMRPKNFLMRLVRQFGHEHGCAGLMLVGNANRVVTKSMRKGKVHADYDSLWLELGARQRRDGDFDLSCEALPALDLSEIASKKRSEARKRHEMLTAALADLHDQIARSKRALVPLRLVAPRAPVTVAELRLRRLA